MKSSGKKNVENELSITDDVVGLISVYFQSLTLWQDIDDFIGVNDDTTYSLASDNELGTICLFIVLQQRLGKSVIMNNLSWLFNKHLDIKYRNYFTVLSDADLAVALENDAMRILNGRDAAKKRLQPKLDKLVAAGLLVKGKDGRECPYTATEKLIEYLSQKASVLFQAEEKKNND